MTNGETGDRIDAVRRFNRFYTRRIGALGEGHLQTPFSLTEARVVYELAQRETATATELGQELGLDAGYLSRILRGFHERGLIDRRPSETDARQSRLSLTEARVIYELAHHERTTATHLSRELGLDAGYLSRILRSFEDRGLIERRASEEDGRRSLVSLTAGGEAAFAGLNAASHGEIEALLAALSEERQRRLLEAMGTIEGLLAAPPEHRVPYILRPP